MCWHYYNPACTAETDKQNYLNEKANLEAEKLELEEEQEELNEESEECGEVYEELKRLATILTSYESTYRSLGAALESVIVNGAAYDKGRCYEIADQIKSIGEDFTEYSYDISLRIDEISERNAEIDVRLPEIVDRLDVIAGKIPDLDTIINRKYWTCASCRALAAKNSSNGPVMEMM